MNPGRVPKTKGFGGRLVSFNALYDVGFKEWFFHTGMLFNADTKWWGDKGCRNRPHEGLDLCLYKTVGGEVHNLDKGAIIPVIFEGEAVKVGTDFLGESVFVCHDIYNSDDQQLLTAYGHLKLDKCVYPGRVFREDAILGSLADTGNREVEIFPHLHISVAWISKSLRYEDLEWEIISDPVKAVLLDPLEVIGCHYSISDSG